MPVRARAGGAFGAGLTIEYPDGCSEIPMDLTKNEMIRRLRILTKTLQEIEPNVIGEGAASASATNFLVRYRPLANYLAADEFVGHNSADVRILVACCLAELLRVMTPDHPFNDPQLLSNVLVFLIRQLRGLENPKDPNYTYFFSLLENMSALKILNIVLDQADSQTVLIQLLKHSFAVLTHQARREGVSPARRLYSPERRNQGAQALKKSSDEVSAETARISAYLLDMIASLLHEIDHVSLQALDLIFENVIEPRKSQSPVACDAARQLITRCDQQLEPYIQTFFTMAMASGTVPDSAIVQSNKTYRLLYELYSTHPDLLTQVVLQLEYKIQTPNDKERLNIIKCVGRMFVQNNAKLHEDCPQLWNSFIGRFKDRDTEIRRLCISMAAPLIRQQPPIQGRPQVQEALLDSLVDLEEELRVECVRSVCLLYSKDPQSVPDDALTRVAERIRDKRFCVRKEAMLCLGRLYRKSLTPSADADVPSTSRPNLLWLADKILHNNFQRTHEDKMFTETVVSSCLTPYDMECDAKMDALIRMFCCIDNYSVLAFEHILKSQLAVRLLVRNLLELHRQDDGEERQQRINKCVRELAEKAAPVPQQIDAQVRNYELIYNFIADDARAEQLLDYVVGYDYTDDKMRRRSKELMTRLSERLGGAANGTTTAAANREQQAAAVALKTLLQRIGQYLCDTDAVQYLITKVSEAVEGRLLVEQQSEQVILARLMHLIKLLSASFGHCFANEPVVKLLLQWSTQSAEQPLVAYSAVTVITNTAPSIEAHRSQFFAELSSRVITCMTELCAGGDPRLAKLAVRCSRALLHLDADQRHEHMLGLLQSAMAGLDEVCLFDGQADQPETRTAAVLSAACAQQYMTQLAVCGAVAELAPVQEDVFDLFDKFVPSLVNNFILADDPACDEATEDAQEKWLERNRINPHTQVKIAAIKTLARFLAALGEDRNEMASHAFKMFTGFLTARGDVRESGCMRAAEMSWLRLAVGSAMLRVLNGRQLYRCVLPSQYSALAHLIVDEVREVRERFAGVLHKRMTRNNGGVVVCSVENLAMYSLLPACSHGGNVEHRRQWQTNVQAQMKRAVAYRREINQRMGAREPAYLPEYSLCYALHLLAHHDLLAAAHLDYDDTIVLNAFRTIKECMWYLLDAVVDRSTPAKMNASCNFVYTLLQQLRGRTDRELLLLTGRDRHATDMLHVFNRNLSLLCELCLLVLQKRVPNFILSSTPCHTTFSSRWFAHRKSDVKEMLSLPAAIVAEEAPVNGPTHKKGRHDQSTAHAPKARTKARAAELESESEASTSHAYTAVVKPRALKGERHTRRRPPAARPAPAAAAGLDEESSESDGESEAEAELPAATTAAASTPKQPLRQQQQPRTPATAKKITGPLATSTAQKAAAARRNRPGRSGGRRAAGVAMTPALSPIVSRTDSASLQSAAAAATTSKPTKRKQSAQQPSTANSSRTDSAFDSDVTIPSASPAAKRSAAAVKVSKAVSSSSPRSPAAKRRSLASSPAKQQPRSAGHQLTGPSREEMLAAAHEMRIGNPTSPVTQPKASGAKSSSSSSAGTPSTNRTASTNSTVVSSPAQKRTAKQPAAANKKPKVSKPVSSSPVADSQRKSSPKKSPAKKTPVKKPAGRVTRSSRR